jgi:ATP:guanido phosphotransferase, N-terminal domain/ATP:guanido phosphotransferase, C-terminal catalytic domain
MKRMMLTGTNRCCVARELKRSPISARSSTGIAVVAAAASSILVYGTSHSDDDERVNDDTKHNFTALSISSKRIMTKLFDRTSLVDIYKFSWQVPCTICEEAVPPQIDEEADELSLNRELNDDFPNLTRHGNNSMLRKILTESMFKELQTRSTASGVTVEDVLRAGVCLPHGAHPPHGVAAGVYAGDAESYTVFAPLLDPIIEQHHKATSRVRLQRFRTNLNPGQLVEHKLDPSGEYILYTRMRLARSIHGFRFAPCMTRQERRTVERLIRDCVSDLEQLNFNDGNTSSTGGYVSVMDMTNKQHDDLVRRQLLFTDPDEYLVSAGLARDWPDSRGIYCDTWVGTPNCKFVVLSMCVGTIQFFFCLLQFGPILSNDLVQCIRSCVAHQQF